MDNRDLLEQDARKIARLERENERLREALKPFAGYANAKGGEVLAGCIRDIISALWGAARPEIAVPAVREFATACLAARTALEERDE